jgi:hypothetical protein
VCLSLLGTFSSSDASERWNPATSSVFQVLTWLAACCTLWSYLQCSVLQAGSQQESFSVCATEFAECACPLPLQVLLSIQGMILIGDPYFNEPSVEQMRSTAQGASTCA